MSKKLSAVKNQTDSKRMAAFSYETVERLWNFGTAKNSEISIPKEKCSRKSVFKLQCARVFLASLFLVSALRCMPENRNMNGAGGGSGSGGGAESVDTRCSKTDGRTSCEGTDVCTQNTYCSRVLCLAGCLSSANCESGDYCDLTAASTDPRIDKKVGLCRKCASASGGGNDGTGGGSSGTGGGTAQCEDVHAAYTVHTSTASSSECPKLSSGSECNVTQTGCSVTLTCDALGGPYNITIDSEEKGDITANLVVSGHPVSANCNLDFNTYYPASFAFNCQITGAGGSVTCVFNGSKKY